MIRFFALIFLSTALFAHADDGGLQAALGEKAHGFLQVFASGATPIMREASLTWDGEAFHLMTIELPHVSLSAAQAVSSQVPHPGGEDVTVVRWNTADFPYNVEVTIRPDKVLEFENAVLYRGAFTALPRIVVSLRNKTTGGVAAQGGFYGSDQPADAFAKVKEVYEKLGSKFIPFASVGDAECERLLREHLIRVPKP
jgi:hypothetical protein